MLKRCNSFLLFCKGLAPGAALIGRLAGYNLKIIFKHQFLYFLLAAIGFFMVVVEINISAGRELSPSILYDLLLVPGLLLVFYPAAFGIQNDADAQMLEVIFGIPDYRYKVWLFRLLLCFTLTAAVLLCLCQACVVLRVHLPVFGMAFHLCFPVFFWGSLAFLFSTLMRNGYGAAIMLVLAGLGSWVVSGSLAESQWNIFLNPYAVPQGPKELMWDSIVRANRVMLAVAGGSAILWGIRNLQRREKFI
jgi:hypothetical protein